MSVIPIAFHPDGTVDIEHQAAGALHTGTVAVADLGQPIGRAGRPETDSLKLSCPSCGAVSTHPVSGGADPERVQALFVLKRAVDKKIAYSAALAEVQTAAAAMDGPERFKLADVTQADIQTGKPDSPVEVAASRVKQLGPPIRG